jgi:hypothetical protein
MQSKDLLTNPAITKTPFKYKVNGISSALCDGDDDVRLNHGACLPNDKVIFGSNIQRKSENSHLSHDLNVAGSTIGPQTSGLVDLTSIAFVVFREHIHSRLQLHLSLVENAPL